MLTVVLKNGIKIRITESILNSIEHDITHRLNLDKPGIYSDDNIKVIINLSDIAAISNSDIDNSGLIYQNGIIPGGVS